MASTYSWGDIINTVKPFVKSIPTSTLDVIVADQVNSFIWKSFFWRWAVFSLTSNSGALNLVDGQQDYSIGTTTGSGFYRLWPGHIRITRTDVSPIIAREKTVVGWLAPNLEQKGSIDAIKAISYEPVTSGLRLDRAASVPSGTSYRIDGEYQFLPIKITSTATAIVFPDQYLNVAIEGVKWKYYQLGDDSRAGEMTTDASGRVQYTGQLAVFMSELHSMREQEDTGKGEGQRFPEDMIGVARSSSPGIFGFY